MRVRPTKILYTTDLSADSSEALRYAIQLARKFEARLYVCHAVNLASLEHSSAMDFVLPHTYAELTSRSEADVRRLVGEPGVPWEPVLVHGEPALAIQAESERLGIDLVVTSTHARSGFKRLLLGSVAERLVRVLSCPVLTVRRPAHDAAPGAGRELRPDKSKGQGPSQTPAIPLRNILVAHDFSANSESVLEYAMSFAQEFQTELHLLHVLEPYTYVRLWSPTEGLARELEKAVDETVRAKLAQIVSAEARMWCTPKTFVASGQPWEQIVQHARSHEIDIMFLGQHGHGLVDRLLIGSTTERVLRELPCPLMVVRPRPLAGDSEGKPS
jgi:nucleotide-binding universal stress UspA family protein